MAIASDAIGRPADAERYLQRCLSLMENSVESNPPIVIAVLTQYAGLLRQGKRNSEAKPLERAEAIRRQFAIESPARYTMDVSDFRYHRRLAQ